MSLDDWTKTSESNKKHQKEKTSNATPAKPEKTSAVKREARKQKKEYKEFEDGSETMGMSSNDLEEQQGNDGVMKEMLERESLEGRPTGESSLKLVGLTTFVLSCARCKVKRTIKATSLRAGHKICKKCGGEMKVK